MRRNIFKTLNDCYILAELKLAGLEAHTEVSVSGFQLQPPPASIKHHLLFIYVVVKVKVASNDKIICT